MTVTIKVTTFDPNDDIWITTNTINTPINAKYFGTSTYRRVLVPIQGGVAEGPAEPIIQFNLSAYIRDQLMKVEIIE